jgi:hypothetical protein
MFISLSNSNLDIGLRSNIIKHHYLDQASPQDRKYASAVCGGIAGGGVTKLMGTESRNGILYSGIFSNQRI